MRWPLAVAMLTGGCSASLRFGAAPTLDTYGRWGGVVQVGGALGAASRHGRAAAMLSVDAATEGDRRPAAYLALGLGLDALVESRHLGFRVGGTIAGTVLVPNTAAGGAVGGRLALLPVLAYRETPVRIERGLCYSGDERLYYHLGLEGQAQYLFGGNRDRGLFSAGPVFELDRIDAPCPPGVRVMPF